MTYQKPDAAFIDYQTYRFGSLDQIFRGPRADLSRPYIACLGAAQTFGRYAPRPFPAIIANTLSMEVANFGAGGAGPGFFLRDKETIAAANRAQVCIVQVMSARSLSNPYFRVKPLRNARIKSIEPPLRRLFPGVDFGRFTFTHGLLNHLASLDDHRFRIIEAMLQDVWVARTLALLNRITAPTILLWLSERAPEATTTHRAEAAMLKYPHFIDREMMNAVAPAADAYVECVSTAGMPQSLLRQDTPVLFDKTGKPVAENRYYPSPEMHEAAALALMPAIRSLLQQGDRSQRSAA